MHYNNFTHVRNLYRMSGCLAVSLEGRRGGLAMLWKEGVDVSIQNYSSHYIDSLSQNSIRFTRFYSHVYPNLRSRSWDILRIMRSMVKED
ncbi:expansin-A1-like [Gossypium australe]|uniref:Expansin-A1-like n=1 Tax=Gossypium australe TaxID=47621 RepID=A0A5B6W5X1_9ROSI|nr:expansin-A1-like [Gossypium australe]